MNYHNLPDTVMTRHAYTSWHIVACIFPTPLIPPLHPHITKDVPAAPNTILRMPCSQPYTPDTRRRKTLLLHLSSSTTPKVSLTISCATTDNFGVPLPDRYP